MQLRLVWRAPFLVVLAFCLAPAAAQATYGFSTTGPPDWIVKCYQPNGTLYAPAYDPNSTPHEKNAPCPYSLTVQNTPQQSPYQVGGLWGGLRKAVLANGYLRFWIPYNALEDYSGKTGLCKQSNFNTTATTGSTGQQLFNDLIWNIQYAQQTVASPLTKLSVDIQIEGASGDPGSKDPNTGYYGDPEYPEPYYGVPGKGYDYGETTAGHDYQCGVQALLKQVHDALTPTIPTVSSVVQWEAMNEPDSRQNDYWPAHPSVARYPYEGALVNACPDASVAPDAPFYDGCGIPPSTVTYNTATTSGNGSLCGALTFSFCGPLEAAELWEIAKSVDTQGYRIAALTSDTPHTSSSVNNGFNIDYIQELNVLNASPSACHSGYPTCWQQYPAYWAIHDYDDPTGDGTGDLRFFENTLSGNAQQPAKVWVTESGVWLNDWRHSDDNYPNGVSCQGDESSEANTLGGCLADENLDYQIEGTRAWQSLLNVSAPNVTTTQVYWFELAAHLAGFDSGLLDTNDVPREQYCILVPSLTCSGSGSTDDFGPGGDT